MRFNPEQARRKIRALEAKAATLLWDSLPGQMTEFNETGIKPNSDIFQAHLLVQEAFDAKCDASVGLQDEYPLACQQYAEALEAYKETLEKYGLRPGNPSF